MRDAVRDNRVVTSCPRCEAPLAADQRYCLDCGERVGERRLDPVALLRSSPEVPEAAAAAAASPAGRRYTWSPRTLGASCLGVLLGGALIGAAFAPGPAGSLAASAGQIIVVSAPAAQDAGGSGDAGPSASFAPSEAPVPPPAPPAAPAPAPAPAPVPAPAPAPAPPAEPPAQPEPPANPEPPPAEKPSIGHVYVVMVPGEPGAEAAYDPESAPSYLRDELRPKGQLLTGFTHVSADAAANRIAVVSGQDANQEYPPETTSLAEQLSTWGLEWRAYVEGMEQPCRHPDPLDPFAAFHSIIDRGDCSQHLLPLDQFDPKPMFSFVAPLAGDQLQTWIDPILKSKPYKKDGLVVVMFDNAPQALVLSPFVKAGGTNDRAYDSYSLVKTIEDRIGLGEHLGGADDKKVRAFGNDVFDTELDPYQDPAPPWPWTRRRDERNHHYRPPERPAAARRRRRTSRGRKTPSWRRGARSWRSSSPRSSGTSAASPTRWRFATTSGSTCSSRPPRSSRRWTQSWPRPSACCVSRAPARRGVYLVRGASRAWGNLLLAVRYSPHGERRGGDDRRFHHPVTWPSHGSPIAHR